MRRHRPGSVVARVVVAMAFAVGTVGLALVPSSSLAATHTVDGVHLVVVKGKSATFGSGPLRRFKVEVEKGLKVDKSDFADAVVLTLLDDRDWSSDFSFRRVSSGHVDFRVTLASRSSTDKLCAPIDTAGTYSCFNGYRSVINNWRWHHGAHSYKGHLAAYRRYLISHEVGHALGHGHRHSCRSDGLAPTMMQQTKSLYGCKRNPWPHPHRG